MRTTFKIEGLRELDQALHRLRDEFGMSKSTAKNLLRRTLRTAAEPIDEAWRARAPVLSGQLTKSGSIGSRLSRSQRGRHSRQSGVEVFVGPGTNPQAITQEFGTFSQPAQPYMRPAWDSEKQNALELISSELAAQIQKTAVRLAKKRAKAGG